MSTIKVSTFIYTFICLHACICFLCIRVVSLLILLHVRPSVICFVYVSFNNAYIYITRILRFPAGGVLTEACAGMIDDKTNNVVGVVFQEIKEETGFVINQSELIELGEIRPSGTYTVHCAI